MIIFEVGSLKSKMFLSTLLTLRWFPAKTGSTNFNSEILKFGTKIIFDEAKKVKLFLNDTQKNSKLLFFGQKTGSSPTGSKGSLF